ncbi:MAG: serine/threonine-protein kinase [Polyangiales bacterium]
MTDAPTLHPGDLFAGDFEVQRALATGGMGAVYVVRQRSTGRIRALKTMLPSAFEDDTLRARFVREATVSSRIESDHVVEVIAAGVDQATALPWISMELLAGADLGATLKQRGQLPHGEAAEVFRQLGHALAAAHRAGVVHRDLKPENIFLAEPRTAGVPFTVKVLDFGIAKVLQESLTSGTSTEAIGSPLWMSPEQTDTGTRIGPPADVFSLGLLAFRTLTGKVFWRAAHTAGATYAAVLRELLVEPIPAASARAAALGVPSLLPAGFDAWFARCVNRDAAARFADAGQATPALLAVLDPRASLGSAPTLEQPAVTPPAYPATVAMPQVPQTPMGVQALAPQGFVSVQGRPPPSLHATPPPLEGDATIPTASPSRLPWIVAAVLGLALLVAVGVLWHWHTQTAHEGAARDHLTAPH